MKKKQSKPTVEKKLHIKKVRPEDHLSIVAMGEDKKLEFEVTYAELTPEEEAELATKYSNAFLPIELIVQEFEGKEKAVSFAGHSSILEFIAINPEGVYKWEHIQLIKYKFDNGKMIHVIVALLPEGEKFNRRRGVRIDIDTRMELEQGDNKIEVIVRDLSYCGFSFTKVSEDSLDFTKAFLLNLIDYDPKSEKTYSVGRFAGKVHRQREDENGNMVYGCILAEKHAEYLQKYVAMKQMERISKKTEYKAVQKNSESQFWKEEVVDALNGLKVERNH
ncbi:MAG: hypothetical protein K5769_05775 [Pseudobutyrivibrio sp.]|nr:hypothetical protein [Pseudobutyrivibrio sp.]